MNILLRQLITFTLSLLCFNFSYAESIIEPSMSADYKLVPSEQIKIAFKKASFTMLTKNHFSTTLEASSKHPMFIIGDFNRDGIKDLIAIGKYEKNNKQVIILSALSNKKSKNYKTIEVNRTVSRKEHFMFLSLNTFQKKDFLLIETDEDGISSHESFYYSTTQKKYNVFRGEFN